MVRPRSLPTVIALLVVLAGCAGTPAPDPGTATPRPTDTATTPASTAPPTTDGYYRRYTVEATPVTPEAVARQVSLTRADVAGEVTWRERAFVRDLFDDGRATRVAIDAPDDGVPGPLDDGTVVRANGTFYAVEKRVVDRRNGRGYRVRLEGPLRERFHEDYDRARREATNRSALPPGDRRLVAFALPGPAERESAVTSAGYAWVFPNRSDAAASRLVGGDRHYVRDGGDLFRVTVTGSSDPVTRFRVAYTLRPVADSASAFAARRLDDIVTPASAVSDAAAPAVVAALNGSAVTWAGEGEAPARYPAAEAWVRERPPAGRTAYVRRDGRLYRVRVSKLVE